METRITRTDLLNHLIEKHGLKTYLELGTQYRPQNFNMINCQIKTCVDINPVAEATYTMSTDDFFRNNAIQYDLIFIDASHHADQVEKDYWNAVKILSQGGYILLHDCNPLLEEHTIIPRPKPSGHWNGNCYLFASQLIDIVTVDIDNGCGVIQYGKTDIDPISKPRNWAEFDKYRNTFLNLVSWKDFVNN